MHNTNLVDKWKLIKNTFSRGSELNSKTLSNQFPSEVGKI